MPVKQLDHPCWVPCAPGEQPKHEGPHWASAERAAEHAEDGETPQPFPAACWTLVCDGLPGIECGEELEAGEEGWTVHEQNAANLGNAAAYEGWEEGPDGTWRCDRCVEELADQAAAKEER